MNKIKLSRRPQIGQIPQHFNEEKQQTKHKGAKKTKLPNQTEHNIPVRE